MGEQIVQGNFVARAKRQGQLPVIIPALRLEEGSVDGHHRHRRLAIGKPPQPERTLLQDLGMRRDSLPRQNIMRGKELRGQRAVSDE